MFLLDTAFVIFHKFPPRMAIREMKMQFACTEQVFQAGNPREWSASWNSQSINTGHTLSRLVERMCSDRLDLNEQAQVAALGSLNLFAITSGMFSSPPSTVLC